MVRLLGYSCLQVCKNVTIESGPEFTPQELNRKRDEAEHHFAALFSMYGNLSSSLLNAESTYIIRYRCSDLHESLGGSATEAVKSAEDLQPSLKDYRPKTALRTRLCWIFTER